MKCDKLQQVENPIEWGLYYDKNEVDATIAELKSEADKFIADLEESHKMEVEQLLMDIAELKKEKEYVIEHTTDVINGLEREIRHHKYKRCLANAEACMHKRWRHDEGFDYARSTRHMNKLLELSEKFKPNN